MNETYFKDYTLLKENVITRSDLQIISKLGSGNFGQVYKGNSQTVCKDKRVGGTRALNSFYLSLALHIYSIVKVE